MRIQNSGAAPRKVSRVERLTNRLTLSVWALQVLLCLLAAVLHVACVFWQSNREFYKIFADNGTQSPAFFCTVCGQGFTVYGLGSRAMGFGVEGLRVYSGVACRGSCVASYLRAL